MGRPGRGSPFSRRPRSDACDSSDLPGTRALLEGARDADGAPRGGADAPAGPPLSVARDGVTLGLYTAERGKPGTGVIPAPASSTLADPAAYIPTDGIIDAVNVALALGQPLLLTGEPGCGKTQLASNLAWSLDLDPLLKFETKSDSTAESLFYRYDSLRHFEASSRGAGGDPLRYVMWKALGAAILATLPPDERRRFDGDTATFAPRRSVVLIDEIDKAPRDFPNDVLNELEHLYFRVPECGNRLLRADDRYRPIVVITSNSERDLPEPFLRRCVFHHIAFPDEETVRRIALSHLGAHVRGLEPLLDEAVAVVRGAAGRRRWALPSPRPRGVPELAGGAGAHRPGRGQARRAHSLRGTLGVLAKTAGDLQRADDRRCRMAGQTGRLTVARGAARGRRHRPRPRDRGDLLGLVGRSAGARLADLDVGDPTRPGRDRLPVRAAAASADRRRAAPAPPPRPLRQRQRAGDVRRLVSRDRRDRAAPELARSRATASAPALAPARPSGGSRVRRSCSSIRNARAPAPVKVPVRFGLLVPYAAFLPSPLWTRGGRVGSTWLARLVGAAQTAAAASAARAPRSRNRAAMDDRASPRRTGVRPHSARASRADAASRATNWICGGPSTRRSGPGCGSSRVTCNTSGRRSTWRSSSSAAPTTCSPLITPGSSTRSARRVSRYGG